MRAVGIWAIALVFYGAFLLWYDNWDGPLTAAEIEEYSKRLEDRAGAPDAERRAALRAFLEEDDGSEFFMLNLIRVHEGDVVDPGSGEPQPAPDVLEVYTDYVMPQIFRRAGHPAFAGPAAGRYLDDWGVEPDPGWSFAGVIRYRSRRDMMEMATDPAFDAKHAYKIAGMANTLAFPVAPAVFFVGPRAWLALALALLASLGQLALGRSQRGSAGHRLR